LKESIILFKRFHSYLLFSLSILGLGGDTPLKFSLQHRGQGLFSGRSPQKLCSEN